jgi:hypothetical protein
MRDSKGLHYLAHLLQYQGAEIHVADLTTLGAAPVNGAGDRAEVTNGHLGAVVDPRAAAEYRARLGELREELDDAAAANDPARAERAHREIDMITHELSAAYGLGGRARLAADPTERVRKAVTNQIRRTVERIHEAHPPLGRHLRNAVRTGLACAYRPERPIDWQV